MTIKDMHDVKATRFTATFTGKDDASVASQILHAAAVANAVVLDLRQTVVQERITLVIELQILNDATSEAELYKSLLSIANELSLSVDFDFAEGGTVEKEAGGTANDDGNGNMKKYSKPTQYALTLVSGGSITPQFMSRLATVLEDRAFRAENITRLSASELRCLEMSVVTNEVLTPSDIKLLRKQLFALGSASGVDVALQAESVLRRSKRLVVFDMDSTLIQQEVIDELARYAGVYEKMAEITHRAMSGALDFKASLRERVALLKGVPSSTFQKVIANLQYTPGAKLLCRTLKRLGYRLAVISGGFTRVTTHVRHELGLDYDYANVLEEENGKFTGRTIGPVVNAQRKADLLVSIAQQERITPDQVIAIGDGANDLPMLGTAGLGVAFNAKKFVQEAARFRINQPSLMTVLFLLGFSEKDQEDILKGFAMSTKSSDSG